MNELDFLRDFTDRAIRHEQFLLNLIITALISAVIAVFYIRFGQSISNRKKYASNFLLLSLTTMLIIYIVKSSVALSLGLVGALSIIRFRTAIKEPEELGFLFLNIGVGLAMGANQVVITVLAVAVILLLMLIQVKVTRRRGYHASEQMYISINTPRPHIEQIQQVLERNFGNILLKRLDNEENQVALSYQVETENIGKVIETQDELFRMSPEIRFSFIEQRNLIL